MFTRYTCIYTPETTALVILVATYIEAWYILYSIV